MDEFVSPNTGAVAHITFSGDFGGRERVAGQLVRGMRVADRIAYLYVFIERRAGEQRNNLLMSALGDWGEELRKFNVYSRFSMTLLKELAAQLKEDEIIISHCHCYKSLFYVALARMLGLWQGIIVFTLHGLILKSDIRSIPILISQYFGMKYTDGIIGCSREILEHGMAAKMKGKCALIINGVNSVFDNYQEIEKIKESARTSIIKRFNLNEKTFILLNVGRLSREKNFSLYLQLAELIKTKQHPVVPRFLIVGSGELNGALKEEAERRSVADLIVFTGFMTEMDTVYLGSDILIQTSSRENTPMCLLEARSFGLPAIVSDVGGTSDVLRNDIDGFVYPSGDLTSLYHSLNYYMQNPELITTHGKRAYEDVATRFDLTNWVNQHIGLYNVLQKQRADRRGHISESKP